MAAKMQTIDDGSEMADDFLCSVCLKDRKNVESVKYCKNCKEYLCQTCSGYHDRFSATANHCVIVKSKVLVPKENTKGIDIGSSLDTEAPRDVPGICVVTCTNNTGRYVILTDWYNELVKVLDLNAARIVESVKLKGKPYGICELPTSGLIAVTLRDNGEVAILRFNPPHLVQQNSNVAVHRLCRGIAAVKGNFNDNILIVNGGDTHHQKNPPKASLSVYGSTNTGDMMYQINSANIVCKQSSCFPRNIAVSKDCKKIYITDTSIGVLVTDMNGQETGRIADPILKGARGICLDDAGNLFVGGMDSDNVVKFTADGQLIGEVVNSSHGIKNPTSLCYIDATRSLLIGSRDKTVPFRVVKL